MSLVLLPPKSLVCWFVVGSPNRQRAPSRRNQTPATPCLASWSPQKTSWAQAKPLARFQLSAIHDSSTELMKKRNIYELRPFPVTPFTICPPFPTGKASLTYNSGRIHCKCQLEWGNYCISLNLPLKDVPI